jgi:hypothetical protein
LLVALPCVCLRKRVFRVAWPEQPNTKEIHYIMGGENFPSKYVWQFAANTIIFLSLRECHLTGATLVCPLMFLCPVECMTSIPSPLLEGESERSHTHIYKRTHTRTQRFSFAVVFLDSWHAFSKKKTFCFLAWVSSAVSHSGSIIFPLGWIPSTEKRAFFLWHQTP